MFSRKARAVELRIESADKGPVAWQRRMAWPGAQGDAGQFDIALAIGDQEDGAVARGGVLQGGTVGDERPRRVGADKLPEVAADDGLGRVGEIPRIETGAELAQLALLHPREMAEDRAVSETKASGKASSEETGIKCAP